MSDTDEQKNEDVEMMSQGEVSVPGTVTTTNLTTSTPDPEKTRTTVLESDKPDESSVTEEQAKTPNQKEGIEVADILPWPQYALSKRRPFCLNEAINPKVCLFTGNITHLKVDAIVNAANDRLMVGGGVCGAIHAAAGKELEVECKTLKGCKPGNAKITGGYNLPAKHVIHTVGPQGEKPDILMSCYERCFEVLLENKLRTIAFPCVGTGIYGFPNAAAAKIALRVTRKFLEEHHAAVDRVIFCLFLPKDIGIYEEFMPIVFPLY